MPWIKAKKYKHPPHAKYAGKWDAGKTPQKRVKGQVLDPTYYNPKTKMYKHPSSLDPKVAAEEAKYHSDSIIPKRQRNEKEAEFNEKDWKYILFDHLASCEMDLPDSWTLGKNNPEPSCIDYKRYDIYGQKRSKPVSKKKANAEFAAGEMKYYGKLVSSKKKKGSVREGFSIFTMGV